MFNVQFTPLVVPMLLAAGLSGFLAYYQWKRGPEIGMASFVTLMIGAAIWTATSALELASPTLQAKFIITVVSYLGVTMATAAWFTFTLEYTGQEKLLTPRYIAFLAVEPVLAITMAATNPLHHLFWRSFELSREGALVVVHGPAFWGHVAYSYLLMLAGAALLIREFIVSPQHYRGQVIALLLAAAAPWAANFLYISQLSPIPNLDLTPFGFTFTGVFLSWNMIHYRLLDVIPIARHTVIQSMGDAMFVLDTRDRILDANPAALHLLEYNTTKKLFGQPMEQVLPPWAEIAKAGHPPGEADHEFKLEAEGEARDIRMHVSPVHNRRGEVRGRVLLLRDITSQKQAEEDLRGVLTAMRDAIMVLDSEGHYLRVPHTNYDLPFQLPADLVGKKMHDIFPAPKVEEFLGYIREALETGKTLRAEYSLPVGEEERWINASISPMEGDRVVWVSRDMTERKRAEEALHESEERFRMLFHDSPDAIVLLDPSVEDPLWPIVDCNEAFLVMNGFERDELIGQSIDVVHDTQGTPEEQRAFLRRIQREGLAHGERLHQRKDGSTYPIHFMANLVNLNGKQLMLGVDRDITERRQAEEALHESEARFRMLFHHSPDAIALLDPSVDDPSWPIVDCNEAFLAMNGFARDELIGQSIDMVHVTEEDPNRRQEFLERLQRDGRVENETTHRRKDGTTYPIHFLSTLVNLNGKQLVLGIDRDITEQKQAEQALHESEERFRMLFHHSPDAIVLFDPSVEDPLWPIVDCNDTFQTMNGYARDELIGQSIEMINLAPTPVEKHREFVRQLKRDGLVERENVHRRKDGTTYPIHFMTTLVTLNGKQLVMGVDRDITEQKQAAQALYESEERFRMLFHHSPDAIVLFDPSVKDPLWPIVDCNEAFLTMNGFERDELIGQSIDVVHLIPGPVEEGLEFLYRLRRGDLVEGENVHRRKDGTAYPVHYMSTLITLNGKQLVMGVDRDITEQKQAEEALHESEERFRMLFHHSPDAIVLLDPSVEDPSWPIVDCNEAFLAMNGFERGDLIGQSIDVVHLTEESPEKRREFLQRLEKEGRVENEITHSRRDGTTYPVHFLTALVKLRGKQLVLGIDRDITDHKRAEAEIQRYRDHLEELVAERTAELNEANLTISASLQEKEVLLKEIHHRVKNNLQVISSLLNLQSGYVEDEGAVTLFTESRNRVHSMALIHEQLYRSTDFTRVDFASYAQELTRRLLISYRALANGIDLRLIFDEIYLDVTTAIPCGLIINELISNAIKHGFPDGQHGVIEVKMAVDERDEGEGYRLTVHNDGVAFPEGLDFRNTDTLGLQLVNSLTRQLDGEIELHRKVGTTFEIRFPRAK